VASSFSAAATEIAALRAGYQQQAELIASNTLALQGNTSAHSGQPSGSAAGHTISTLFGGALSLLSPVLSGLSHLFGAGSAPAALPLYIPPPSVSIGGILHAGNAQQTTGSVPAAAQQAAAGSTYAPQITVHVNAMDSQSFMDRSGDIANAVREAMLNNHPINGVVAEL